MPVCQFIKYYDYKNPHKDPLHSIPTFDETYTKELHKLFHVRIIIPSTIK